MTGIVERLDKIDHQNPRSVLDTALDFYGDKIVLAMSFQVGGCVLLDMIHRLGRKVDVISLDTGRLPEETYECAEQIRKTYGVAVKWMFPRREDVQQLIREKGVYSFRESVTNRKQCCGIRKVEPLTRGLEPYAAWITGRRTDQSGERVEMSVVEDDSVHPGKIKINPLVDWTIGDLWHYIQEHNVPYNRLYDEGYLSIGCECCTRPCKTGEGERAGRWWWESEGEKKECGLHIVFKDGSGI